jgi:hypothetical protein
VTVTGPFRPADPIRMNHPDIPGQENVLERREIYLVIWRPLGWLSDDVEDDLVFAVPGEIWVEGVAGDVGEATISAVPGEIWLEGVAGTLLVVFESFDKADGALGPDLAWTPRVFFADPGWQIAGQRARFGHPEPAVVAPPISESFTKANGPPLGSDLTWTRKVFA